MDWLLFILKKHVLEFRNLEVQTFGHPFLAKGRLPGRGPQAAPLDPLLNKNAAVLLYSPRFAWGGRPHRSCFRSVNQ